MTQQESKDKTMTICSIENYLLDGKKDKNKQLLQPYITNKQALSILLKNKDKNLHIHLKKNIETIIFGDIDKKNNENDINLIIKKIETFFNRQASYTIAKNDDGLFGSHFVIPNLKCSNIQELKNIMKQFDVDTSVYRDGLFRLPNQTEKTKKNKHEIVVGKMQDFVYLQNNLDNIEFYKSNDTIMNKSNDTIMNKSKEQIIADLIDINDIDNYDTWLSIIWSVDIDLARYISQRSYKFNEEQFVKYYNDNKKNSINKNTFYYYAKKGNPKKFAKLVSKNEIQEESTELNDTIQAETFVKHLGEYHLNYKNELYNFNGFVWIKANGLDNIKIDIKNKLSKIYQKSINKYKIKLDEAKDPNKLKKYKSKIKSLTTLKNRCLNNTTMNSIASVVKLDIINNNIEFENNPYLFCFENKIFNIQTNEEVEPNPLDYLLLTTKYNYEEPTDLQLQTIEDIITQIFPIEEEKVFYMNILYESLVGQVQEKFVMANGRGGNGKGVLHDILLSMLGDYGYIAPNSIITNPLKSGPNPEVANMSHKRFVLMREPSDSNGTKLCFGTIKELTGGAKLNARACQSNDTDVYCKMLLMLECNTRLEIDVKVDNSVLRRVLDVIFRSMFSDLKLKEKNNEEIEEYEYEKYPEFSTEKFKKNHRTALFKTILKYKSNLTLDELTPSAIKERTNSYIKSCDTLVDFMNENYERTDREEDIVLVKDLYEVYKRTDYYYSGKRKTKKIITQALATSEYYRRNFKERLQTRHAKMLYGKNGATNCLIGFKPIEEDIEED